MDPMDVRRDMRDALVDAGWLRLTSVDGVFARTAPYLAVEAGLTRVLDEAAAGTNREVLRFPPVFPADSYLRTDYLASFPQLTGAVQTFRGDEHAAAELLERQLRGEDWTRELEPSGLMMVSAACHPTYALFSGTLPESSVQLDVEGWCFRHEPSVDPTRAQSFRMREFVFIGDPQGAEDHRDAWIARGLEILSTLGIQAEAEVANDPFFGRGGRMLATNQRVETLKFELTSRLFGDEEPGTPVVSSNCHRDHFGLNFGISTPDGEVAHSACVGFGTERVVVALFAHHGALLEDWPASVRQALWP